MHVQVEGEGQGAEPSASVVGGWRQQQALIAFWSVLLDV
jgi:hypothetical protein